MSDESGVGVDRSATPVYCPFCAQELIAAGEVGHSTKKESAVVECDVHGEIELEWSYAN